VWGVWGEFWSVAGLRTTSELALIQKLMHMQGLNGKGNKLYKLESHDPHFKARDLGSQGGERKEKV